MQPSKTKVVCKACNSRRVRCDRTDETPCSRCRTTGQDCEPTVSKRGYRSGFRHSFGPVPDTPDSGIEAICLSAPTTFQSEGSARGSTAPSSAHPNPTESQSGRTIYYGDYFSLEYTRKELDDSHEDYNPRMNSTRFAHGRARLDQLGAFDMLDSRASDKLIRTLFELIYPVAPILDRKDFFRKLETGHASPLLLQAIYMVAFLHCESSILRMPGSAIVIQALLCLSFWWETPTQQKDMWYWTGISMDLAQSLGMHQEKVYSTLDEKKSKLWRRLWWTIYSHDISTAVQLGRIPHVHDGYCTARLVTEQDFGDDDFPERFGLGGNATKEAQLQTIYLADLLSNCHRSLCNGRPNPSLAFGNMDSLVAWKASLPVDLQCPKVLNLTYYCFEIILRRNHFRNPRAAVEIVRILEDTITSELLTACPLRLLPPTFAALSVLLPNMCRPASEVTEVSKHRARLCMLVLSKLVDYWPPGLSYYRLFARILAPRGCEVPDEPAPPAGVTNPEGIGMNALFPFSAFLNDEFLENDLNLGDTPRLALPVYEERSEPTPYT
ncbi:fungal-specific transcription factor domain-containing protein [Aspergillus desertorum]